MHIACMLGNKFSVIDLAESHNMYYYNLVVQHRFTDRCASIRNIVFPHPRPGFDPGEASLAKERERARKGEPSEAVERSVREAVAAIEEDIQTLNVELKEKTTGIIEQWEAALDNFEELPIRPRRIDVEVNLFALAWVPYWQVDVKAGNVVQTNLVPGFRV